MKRFFVFMNIIASIICNYTFAQKNESILIGRSYSKSANSNSTIVLKFNSKKDGVALSSDILLGKVIRTTINFTYSTDGKNLVIEYEENLGTEKYTIDEAKGQLLSTHLQGYVDGKWGKIYWKRYEN